MSIFVGCSCGAKLKLSDALAGKVISCPKCKTPLTVPSLRVRDLGMMPPTVRPKPPPLPAPVPAEDDFDFSPPLRKPGRNRSRAGLWIGLGAGVFILSLATIGATLWATGWFSKAGREAISSISLLPRPGKKEAADAIKALDRVKAAVEVGVTFQKYGELVIDAQTAVNDAKRALPDGDLVANLSGAVQAYKDVVTIWNFKIQHPEVKLHDDVGFKEINARYSLKKLLKGVLEANGELKKIKENRKNLGLSDEYELSPEPDWAMQIIWAVAGEKLANARRLQ
jgi:hypothetical protein